MVPAAALAAKIAALDAAVASGKAREATQDRRTAELESDNARLSNENATLRLRPRLPEPRCAPQRGAAASRRGPDRGRKGGRQMEGALYYTHATHTVIKIYARYTCPIYARYAHCNIFTLRMPGAVYKVQERTGLGAEEQHRGATQIQKSRFF